jgi:hypothetical protein
VQGRGPQWDGAGPQQPVQGRGPAPEWRVLVSTTDEGNTFSLPQPGAVTILKAGQAAASVRDGGLHHLFIVPHFASYY